MEFNDDILIRLVEKQDFYDIVLRSEDEHIRANPNFDSWAEETANGAGFTGVRKSDGKILGCGGIKVFRPGCGEAWGIYSDEVGKYAKEARSYAKYYLSQLMQSMGLHWLQCIVDADKKINLRFAKSAGFEIQTLLGRYRPNGDDCYLLVFKRELPITNALALNVDPSAFSGMDLRNKMQLIEDKIIEQPGAMMGDAFPLEHSFAKGLYVRQIKAPAGSLITGKIHKHSHAFFLLKGDISILMDNGVKRIKAPAMFITPAGTKRVVYHHADTVVTTVHATDETDIGKIEDEIIAKNWDELDLYIALSETKYIEEAAI